MAILQLVLDASIMAFMVCGLAGAGLGVAPRHALASLRDGRFVLVSVVISWIVCPLAAVLLLQVVPLDRPYATGLLLLALAPCAPFAPAVARRAGGDSAYMAAFIVLSAAGTVAFMPIAVPLFVPGVSAHPMTIAKPLLLFVLLPLALGTLIRGVRPRTADRLEPMMAAITRAATLALLVIAAFIYSADVFNAIGSYAIVTEIVFLAAVALAAGAIGARLPAAQRTVLTIGICTRNLGAALAPLAAIDADRRTIVMVVIAVPATLAISALAARALVRGARGPSQQTRAA